MKNVHDILMSENIKEEKQAFDFLEKTVDEINEYADSVTNLLRHSRMLFLLSIVFFFFGLSKYIWIGSISLWFIVFLVTSNKNQKRIEMMNNFKNWVLFFEIKKLINDDNRHLLKNFKIKRLWFEE
jgi:zona occludens toxin (predicted ATPase)